MDERHWSEEKKDNFIALDLTLTTASTLYLAIRQALIVFDGEIALTKELIRKLNSDTKSNDPRYKDSELQKLKYSLESLQLIVSTNRDVLKEVGNIIQELEPSEHTPKTPLIIKP